jgi:hypothetical protein
MSAESFETRFASLRERFSTRLSAYQSQLRMARMRFVSGSGDDGIRDLKRISHELAGAAGAFDFVEIGEAALALERAADDVLLRVRDRNAIIAPLRELMREIDLTV